jgi:hypothetical protein
MPGRPSQSNRLQYLGALAALVAVVGYVGFGWRFGATDGAVPFVIGAGFALVVVGWTVYQWVR